MSWTVVNADNWSTEHNIQVEKIAGLKGDFELLRAHVANGVLLTPYPWDALYQWSEQKMSLKGQEQLVSLMMEPYGELVDGLTQFMNADEFSAFPINGGMSIGAFRTLLEENYNWALSLDTNDRNSRARFWYVSQEKLEPRMGERFEEPGAEYEQPYGIGFGMFQLHQELESWDDEAPLANILLERPEYRHLVRRAQLDLTHVQTGGYVYVCFRVRPIPMNWKQRLKRIGVIRQFQRKYDVR